MNPKALKGKWLHEWSANVNNEIRCVHCALPQPPASKHGIFAKIGQALSDQECPVRLRKELAIQDELVIGVLISVLDADRMRDHVIHTVKHFRTHVPKILDNGLIRLRNLVVELRDALDAGNEKPSILIHVRQIDLQEFLDGLTDLGLDGYPDDGVLPASIVKEGWDNGGGPYGDFDKAERLRDALVKQPELLAQVRMLLNEEGER